MAPTRDAFARATDAIPIDFGCAGPRLQPSGAVIANVLVRTSALEELEKRRDVVRVEVVGDLSADLAARRREVGQGNRFADPHILPEGLGVLVHEEPS